MTKRPALSESLAAMEAKRERDMSTKPDSVMWTKAAVEAEARIQAAKSIPHAIQAGRPEAAGTLPKLTLYAHGDVLKAIRRIAVDDGVQAQVILRDAVRDYLAKRGHHFSDLTTGK